MYEKGSTRIEYLRLLKKYHSLRANILEIGCGHDLYIARSIEFFQQKYKAGTITAMDHTLAIKKAGNVILFPQKFDDYDKLKKYDLIVAKEPCAITMPIIYGAVEYQIDLFLHLCSCPLLDEEDLFVDAEEWHLKACRYIENNAQNIDQINILRLKNSSNDLSPLISLTHNRK